MFIYTNAIINLFDNVYSSVNEKFYLLLFYYISNTMLVKFEKLIYQWI